jgi:hypothetical protein
VGWRGCLFLVDVHVRFHRCLDAQHCTLTLRRDSGINVKGVGSIMLVYAAQEQVYEELVLFDCLKMTKMS